MKRNDQAYIVKRNHRTKLVDLLSDETIFSLANGTLGTRGHFAEGYGTDEYFPITLINGIYNTYPFHYEENYAGFPQKGQAIVTLPDTSLIKIKTSDGLLDLTHAKLIDIERSLDMKRGFTTRIATYKTKKHTFIIKERKLVMANRLGIVMELTISSPSYQGLIEIESYLRMPSFRYVNTIDPRLPNVRKELMLKDLMVEEQVAYLKAQTTNSHQRINVSMTHDKPMDYTCEKDFVVGVLKQTITPQNPLVITKYTLYTSSFLQRQFNQRIKKIKALIFPFDQYVKDEETARKPLWRRSSLTLSNKDLEQALYYNMYQLNLNAGRHHATYIAAKGITGTGYEGHYFWDAEAYMLPYFILTNPHRAKKILMYRYLTLDASRHEARKLGIKKGAKIAWRTINGEEASAYFLAGSAQIHINSDVALAMIQYYYATYDEKFMNQYAMEVILETARFLIEWGTFDDAGHFHLYGVTGPDEYKTLVNDNYYTNRLAKEHFSFIIEYLNDHDMTHLLNKLHISQQELRDMKQAANHMTLLIDDKLNMIKQDDSFMNKKALPLESIALEELPLLLSKHPLDIYRLQISKQADAILAPVLFGDEVDDTFKNTFAYYVKRTTHDSSLSRAIFGIAAYMVGDHHFGYDYLKRVTDLDFRDSHNRTQHGLHIANLGGSYLMVIYGLFGLRMGKVLSLNPAYQTELSYVKTRILYQGARLWLTLTPEKLTIETNQPLEINIYNKRTLITKTATIQIKK